jgi:monovalent cation:H+ antiporter, CPA1 family
MELFHIFSAILVISAIFAYINQKFIKLPGAIGLLLAGLLLSLLVQGLGVISPGFEALVEGKIREIDFSEVLLEFMLSFLLFAGALHTDLEKLSASKWPIRFLLLSG